MASTSTTSEVKSGGVVDSPPPPATPGGAHTKVLETSNVTFFADDDPEILDTLTGLRATAAKAGAEVKSSPVTVSGKPVPLVMCYTCHEKPVYIACPACGRILYCSMRCRVCATSIAAHMEDCVPRVEN